MRVISGSAKRIRLRTPKGMTTRPTADRIKETLFNMLSERFSEGSFLDLFAGSGGIGIEALSRGAKTAVFVEQNKEALFCIRENLKSTGLEKKALILPLPAAEALKRLEGKGRFDCVFMDPPYDCGLEKSVLMRLSRSSLVDGESLIVAEASLDTPFSYLEEAGFRLVKEKRYKTSKHIFMKKTKEKNYAEGNLSGQL